MLTIVLFPPNMAHEVIKLMCVAIVNDTVPIPLPGLPVHRMYNWSEICVVIVEELIADLRLLPDYDIRAG